MEKVGLQIVKLLTGWQDSLVSPPVPAPTKQRLQFRLGDNNIVLRLN